jgi:predicted GNAT family acetyltransferase
VPLADYDDLIAQLCSIKTPPNMERVEDLVTKQKMKDEGIKSPDRADSLAMQYATQAPRFETRSAEARSHIVAIASTAMDGF